MERECNEGNPKKLDTLDSIAPPSSPTFNRIVMLIFHSSLVLLLPLYFIVAVVFTYCGIAEDYPAIKLLPFVWVFFQAWCSSNICRLFFIFIFFFHLTKEENNGGVFFPFSNGHLNPPFYVPS